MTEYKQGDVVWVPATVAETWPERNRVYIRLFDDHRDPVIGLDADDVRIRVEGAAPDESKLREACQAALNWFANTSSLRTSDVLTALRAALAATEPVEGPVREGDRFHIFGEAVSIEDDYVMVRFDGSVSKTPLNPLELVSATIVSRPAPAETCERCRWWYVDPNGRGQWCLWPYNAEKMYPTSPSCSHFERWPG